MENKKKANDSKEEQFPTDDFLQELEVNFRALFGIINTIQEDMISKKSKSRMP